MRKTCWLFVFLILHLHLQTVFTDNAWGLNGLNSKLSTLPEGEWVEVNENELPTLLSGQPSSTFGTPFKSPVASSSQMFNGRSSTFPMDVTSNEVTRVLDRRRQSAFPQRFQPFAQPASHAFGHGPQNHLASPFQPFQPPRPSMNFMSPVMSQPPFLSPGIPHFLRQLPGPMGAPFQTPFMPIPPGSPPFEGPRGRFKPPFSFGRNPFGMPNFARLPFAGSPMNGFPNNRFPIGMPVFNRPPFGALPPRGQLSIPNFGFGQPIFGDDLVNKLPSNQAHLVTPSVSLPFSRSRGFNLGRGVSLAKNNGGKQVTSKRKRAVMLRAKLPEAPVLKKLGMITGKVFPKRSPENTWIQKLINFAKGKNQQVNWFPRT